MNGVKSPFYKNWLFIAIVVLVIIAGIGIVNGGDKTKTNVTNGSKDNEKVETVAAQTENSNTEDHEIKEELPEVEFKGAIPAGTYKVGTDIPSGEYVVFSTGDFSFVEALKDPTDVVGSLIFGQPLIDMSHTYVTIKDGDYFRMQNAEMYPVAEAPSLVPADGIYTDAMFLVGKDLPAGEYKVFFDNPDGIGYYEINKDSRHDSSNIIENDVLEADSHLSVSDGQYLILIDVYIEVK